MYVVCVCARGCNTWSISHDVGDSSECVCETIGRMGGRVVYCLCILGMP